MLQSFRMADSFLDPSLYQDAKPASATMDGPLPQMSTPPYPENNAPAQSDVDEFLRKKRKAREHKACYPCRQRKVKYVQPSRRRLGAFAYCDTALLTNASTDAISPGRARHVETETIRSFAHTTLPTRGKA